jgi:hypothetical protein
MISFSLGRRAKFLFVFREARRSTPMMAADRSTRSSCAILFLIVSFGLPRLAAATTLEDSAKELAQKIAAALPVPENVSCEIRNQSSLKADETARVDQTLKAELQNRGVRISDSGSTVSVVVTLSENFKNLIWTAEIREGESLRLILMAPNETPENRDASSPLPVTIHRDKFWEGRDHILDALEVAGIGGEPWVVLLLRDSLLVQQPSGRIEITFPPPASRNPVGKLGQGENGKTILFLIPPRMCSTDQYMRRLIACLPMEGNEAAPASGIPFLIDSAPGGPMPPGKEIGLAIGPICTGDEKLVLVTGGRDHTQTDSLQVFRMESGGPVAVSSELEFAGPILELHSAALGPRAVVRNLTTGNYEAYRLSISCGQ